MLPISISTVFSFSHCGNRSTVEISVTRLPSFLRIPYKKALAASSNIFSGREMIDSEFCACTHIHSSVAQLCFQIAWDLGLGMTLHFAFAFEIIYLFRPKHLVLLHLPIPTSPDSFFFPISENISVRERSLFKDSFTADSTPSAFSKTSSCK